MKNTIITPLRAYTIWFVMALFVAYSYFFKASYGVVIERVSNHLGIDYSQAGLLSSVFFYVYAFVQLIIGLLITRVSMRVIVTSAILLSAVGMLIFTWTTSFPLAVLARLIMGIGTAFSLTTAIHMIGKLFPPHRFAFMVGLTNCVANLCGSGFGVMVFVKSGYDQYSMTIVGAIGLIMALAVWVSILEDRQDQEKAGNTSSLKTLLEEFKADFLAVISSIQIWSIALYGGIVLGSFIAFGNLWNIPFQRANGLSMDVASFMNLLIMLGIASGSVAIGWFSDLIQQRLFPAFFSTVGAFSMIGILLYLPQSDLFVKYIALFFFGFFSGSVYLSYAMVHDYVPKNLQGMSIGFVVAMTSLVGGALQHAVGKILMSLSQVEGIAGHQFTVLQYQQALSLLPSVLACALVLLFIIKISTRFQNIQKTITKST